MDLLISIPGIAANTAVELLGEIACMPDDLSAKQLLAQAGLDPKPNRAVRLRQRSILARRRRALRE